MSKLYVAYGSNLNMGQMKGRCPEAEFVGTGIVENHELQFKGSLHGAYATIALKEGASVPVGIWTIQKQDEARLDVYEGVRQGFYFKEQVPVKMNDGSTLTGMVYIMDLKNDFGRPHPEYYATVRQGYRDCGLDTAVLDQAVKSSMELAQQRMASSEMQMY
ncbi:MAG: gamma-glutamylcyclotransferase [Oscillospiraceae bacterium]|nr:gamma-glutamylcyclotransferase [Oscillospiraceae bacterium]